MVIGFFMPLPLAMMIPFMGIQSAVMAKQFGENFQYGKRRISAMSNDEFNKLTPKMIQDNANAELKAMIPSMQASVTDMRGFQEFLVKEFIRMVDSLLQAGLGSVLGLTEQAAAQAIKDIEHFLHGHFDLHSPSTSPEPEPIAVPPPPVTDEPEPVATSNQADWLLTNATGRISYIPNGEFGPTFPWQLQSNINGTWTNLSGQSFREEDLVAAINNALQAWPSSGYNQFGVKLPSDTKTTIFFYLKSKTLPT